MNLGELKVKEGQQLTIQNPIKEIMETEVLAILTKAFKNMSRHSRNRLKITCDTRDEAKKLGD